jgi:hypothetical protein
VIRNSSQAQAELLMVMTVRVARFFSDIGARQVGPSPPAKGCRGAAFPAHVAAYGYWVASPAENAAVGLGFN